jgi:hypothetical protein
MDSLTQESTDFYLTYLHEYGLNLEAHNFDPEVESILKETDLENPTSALDWHNLAILTLIETA